MKEKINILKTIGVMFDMDDVISHGGFLHLINLYLGTHYTVDDFKNYYMQDVIPEESREDFFKFVFSRNLYDYCELEPYAYETLEACNRLYKTVIGTSYIFPEYPKESGILLLQKHNYLLEKLPFLTPMNFSFTNDKSIFNFQVRVDDKLANLEGAIIKILYTAYHNKSISDEILKALNVERADNLSYVKKRLVDDVKSLVLK